ncbi:hypothetical protein NQ176_g3368 [Zarea fungicola]|uniref:Uncharacterized protein n=1 Tax=Zarea fungicola TaxID=93591 RepID=A0ACC1NKX0_9HYPO|nr:hypothetical protein NQ176_g3368 [Lecanicillium fungicola]
MDRDFKSKGNSVHVDSDLGLTSECLTAEDDRRILRRLDLCLLPVMALTYLFQYLDKSALAATAIMGLPRDLHLSGSQYSWASAINNFGGLAASYPLGVLMVRWKVGKTVATSILVSGMIMMLMAACFNAGGLLAARFFLGAAEAAIAPGQTIIISMFYKRREQPLRHAVWFLGNTCAGAFGGLLNYGISHIESIAPWKASYLIIGATTFVWSIFLIFILPDTPLSALLVPKADRSKIIIRVQENLTGVKSDEFKWNQLVEALLDVKTWILVGIQLASNIPNGGITSFRSIILKGIGFSTFDTLLLQCVPYLVQFFLVILGTVGSTYCRNTRTYWMMLNSAIALTGSILVQELPAHSKWGRYVGTCIMGANSASFPLLVSILSGNIGGFTKKSVVNSINFIAACTGNIIGPQLFYARQAPRYTSGFIALIVCHSTSILLTLVLRFYFIFVNKSRDKRRGSDIVDSDERQAQTMRALFDETDKEIEMFRYVY